MEVLFVGFDLSSLGAELKLESPLDGEVT